MVGGPPPQPPSVTGQQGAPLASVAQGIAARAAQGGGGTPGVDDQSKNAIDKSYAAHPKGAFLAQTEILRKSLEQIGKTEEAFAPFAQRMIEIMRMGVDQVAKSNPDAGPPAGAGQTAGGPVATKPPDGSQVGATAPGFPG